MIVQFNDNGTVTITLPTLPDKELSRSGKSYVLAKTDNMEKVDSNIGPVSIAVSVIKVIPRKERKHV